METCKLCGVDVDSPCQNITDVLRCPHVSVGEAELIVEFVPDRPSAPYLFELEDDLPSKEDTLGKFAEEPSDMLRWAMGMEKKPPRPPRR